MAQTELLTHLQVRRSPVRLRPLATRNLPIQSRHVPARQMIAQICRAQPNMAHRELHRRQRGSITLGRFKVTQNHCSRFVSINADNAKLPKRSNKSVQYSLSAPPPAFAQIPPTPSYN